MKNIKLRKGISSILLAGVMLVTGSSLTGCSENYPNNNSTFVDKEHKDEGTAKTKIFQPGEHIISKRINDITESDENNPYNEINQIEYHEGYKCVGLGISVRTPYKGTTAFFDEGSIVYINEYEVECKSSGEDKNGNKVYTDFGKPINYTITENKEIDDEKEFEIGTHILTVPVISPEEADIQYTYHDGYELVDIALTGKTYRGNNAIAMYINTEKVKCKKTGSNKETGDSEFHEFGTPVEKNKTLIK